MHALRDDNAGQSDYVEEHPVGAEVGNDTAGHAAPVGTGLANRKFVPSSKQGRGKDFGVKHPGLEHRHRHDLPLGRIATYFRILYQ